MKLLPLLLFLPLSGYAQGDTLYAGISKPLLINQLGYTCGDLKATGIHCYLSATTDPCAYGLEADTPGTATVYIRSRRDDKLLETRTYTVLRLPNDAIPTVGGKRSGTITAAALSAQTRIVLADREGNTDLPFVITSFTAAITRAQKIWYSGQSNEADFPEAMRAAFSQLQAGDRVFFSDIRCLGPDAKPRRLVSIELTIE